MLRQPRQLVSAGIAIVLGVAFVAVTLVFGASMNAGIRQIAAGTVGDAAVVIGVGSSTSADTEQVIPTGVADAAAALPGVTAARKVVSGYSLAVVNGATSYLPVTTQPSASSTTTLVQGRWANGLGEVTISKAARDDSGISLGQKLAIRAEGGQPGYYTVVGVIDPGYDAVSSPTSPYLFAGSATAMAMTGLNGYTNVYLSSNQDARTLRDSIQKLPGVSTGQLTVKTASDEVNAQVKQLSHGTDVWQDMLLGFAAIALFVGAIVITNTFAILITQRIRQLALLRCIGATRNQVFRMVVGEALFLGAAGSAVGIGAGFGLAAVLLPLGQRSLGSPLPFTVSPSAVLIPLLVGLAVTTFAAFSPARRATRVAPLAALHPELAATAAKRITRGRLLGGLPMIALGAVLLGWGVTRSGDSATRGLVMAMIGGVLSFLGILVLSRAIIPGLAQLLGRPLSSSVTGDLAVANSRRNPARAAATANALLVGVTLIGLLTVGAATGQAATDRTLASHYPQDAIVTAPQGADQRMLDSVRQTQGVAAASLVPGVTATARSGGTSSQVDVTGVSDRTAQVTRFPSRYTGLDDNTARTSDTSFRDGQSLTLDAAGHSVQVVVRVSKDYSGGLVVSTGTLSRLAPDAQQRIWVRYSEGTDATKVTTAIGRSLSSTPGVQVESGAQMRAAFQQIIDIMLAVATGLLTVAVVIAVVGVANTLGLSVLERTQEIGLLRAMGMTRRQVRRMIGLEAVTLSGVAAVLGLLLGTAYGLLGAKSLLGIAKVPMVVGLPWGRLLLILAIAVAAGWVASLAPAARAVRITPSAALATE